MIKKVKIKISTEEFQHIVSNVDKIVDEIKSKHGNISGLTSDELMEIYNQPEYKNIQEISLFVPNEKYTEEENFARLLIIKGQFQKHGIKF